MAGPRKGGDPNQWEATGEGTEKTVFNPISLNEDTVMVPVPTAEQQRQAEQNKQ